MKVVAKKHISVVVALEITGEDLGRLAGILGHHSVSSHKAADVPSDLAEAGYDLFGRIRSACEAAGVDWASYYRGELS